MQTIRGYVFFENKNLSDIKNAFVDFRFDKAVFSYFTSIIINEKTLNCPGVFLNGEIKLNYDRIHIVKLFRKLLNLTDEIKNYNLSLSSVDILRPIVTDRQYGCYSCLVMKRTSNLDNIELLADKIKRMFEPRDLFIRTISGEENSATCIDMIGESYLDHKSEEITGLINELGLVAEYFSRTNLMK